VSDEPFGRGPISSSTSVLLALSRSARALTVSARVQKFYIASPPAHSLPYFCLFTPSLRQQIGASSSFGVLPLLPEAEPAADTSISWAARQS